VREISGKVWICDCAQAHQLVLARHPLCGRNKLKLEIRSEGCP